MLFVHVYLRAAFEGDEGVSQPMQLWTDCNAVIDSTVQKTGLVLYDEECVYVYYKKDLTAIGDPYSLYAATGEYIIVVIK